jgi:hypothetical protein
VKPLQFFLLLLAVFLAPQFLRAQMPSRQPGGPPSAQPSMPNMPDSSGAPPQPAVPERASVIYVTDFELDSADSSAEPAPARSAARPANDSAPHVSTSAKADPSAAQAQHIVKIMSENLLKDFAKAGYTTKLLRASDPRPDDGFLIAGVFTQVGTDNRLRRVVLGSGQGADAWQLYASARDLAHFTPPLYEVDPADVNSEKPGAAILLNPNADAVKFSVEADLTDKSIKQTAQHISAELLKQIKIAEKSDNERLNRYAKP